MLGVVCRHLRRMHSGKDLALTRSRSGTGSIQARFHFFQLEIIQPSPVSLQIRCRGGIAVPSLGTIATDKEGRKMNMKLLVVLVMGLGSVAEGQILEDPCFSFERLSWQMSLDKATRALANHEFKKLEVPRGSLIHRGSNQYTHFYIDTMWNIRVCVGLQFGKPDSTLQSILVTYLGIDTTSKRSLGDADQTPEILLQRYSARLGPGFVEKSFPFGGGAKQWVFRKTSVQILYMSSLSMLCIVFEPSVEEETRD